MAANDPIYKQIKSYLEDLIAQNQNNPQYKLPSENQISLKFNSSRVPPKRALQELEEEGRIFRLQGKGTFIRQTTATPADERKSVCLLLPNTLAKYFNDMITGVRRFLDSVNVDLFLTMTGNDSLVEENMIYSAVNKRFSGILIFPVVYHTYNDALLKLVLKRYPVVFIGRSLPGLNISSVCCDHYLQTYHATNFLIHSGHRDIGFISESGSSSPSYAERIRGYRTCIFENSVNNRLHQFEIEFFSEPDGVISLDEIDRAVDRFFMDNPEVTAIITNNNTIEHIYSYMHKQRIPPEKITIMVFDESENPDVILNHHPIIIDQQPELIGYLAAEQLYRQMMNNEPPKQITVEEKIIVPDVLLQSNNHIANNAVKKG